MTVVIILIALVPSAGDIQLPCHMYVQLNARKANDACQALPSCARVQRRPPFRTGLALDTFFTPPLVDDD